jgi:hypothetical protein
MLRHVHFYMKGGFQIFAASARWECVNSESRHSHCRGTQFFCTAARRLGALFAKCCVLREHLLCTWSAIFIQYGTALLERINQHPHTFVQTLVGTIDDLHIECFEFEARQDRDKIAVVNRCGHQEVRQAG